MTSSRTYGPSVTFTQFPFTHGRSAGWRNDWYVGNLPALRTEQEELDLVGEDHVPRKVPIVKRTAAAVAAIALAASVTFAAGSAVSEELPEHGHLFLTGLEFDDAGEPIAYKKCRVLAHGQALPLNAHHEHMHTGRAGEAQFENAGNATVPMAPLAPWSNCAEFAEIIFGE